MGVTGGQRSVYISRGREVQTAVTMGRPRPLAWALLLVGAWLVEADERSRPDQRLLEPVALRQRRSLGEEDSSLVLNRILRKREVGEVEDSAGAASHGHHWSHGGGSDHHSDHHSSHGHKADKGYKGHHHHDHGKKGHHDKEGKSGHFEEHGGHKKKHHDEGGYHKVSERHPGLIWAVQYPGL